MGRMFRCRFSAEKGKCFSGGPGLMVDHGQQAPKWGDQPRGGACGKFPPQKRGGPFFFFGLVFRFRSRASGGKNTGFPTGRRKRILQKDGAEFPGGDLIWGTQKWTTRTDGEHGGGPLGRGGEEMRRFKARGVQDLGGLGSDRALQKTPKRSRGGVGRFCGRTNLAGGGTPQPHRPTPWPQIGHRGRERAKSRGAGPLGRPGGDGGGKFTGGGKKTEGARGCWRCGVNLIGGCSTFRGAGRNTPVGKAGKGKTGEGFGRGAGVAGGEIGLRGGSLAPTGFCFGGPRF